MPRVRTEKIEVGLPGAAREELQKRADDAGMELSGYIQTLIQQASGVKWDITRLHKGTSKKDGKPEDQS